MSHKADEAFFKEKRPWSRRKDRLLGSYIKAYLPKIATQRRSVLVVDGFAGPGKFDDGEPGSPLILCQVIKEAISGGLRVPVRLMCIELMHSLFARLNTIVGQFEFAEPKEGQFIEFVDQIKNAARSSSVFLYADPFTVEGLIWSHLEQIASHLVTSRVSVEFLVNFNAASFVRRGLAALALHVPDVDVEKEDPDDADAVIAAPASIDRLNQIVGTDEWQELLRVPATFPQRVESMRDLFVGRLRRHFAEVCSHAMIAQPNHSVPKYYLVFATRHPDGLELMNDEVVKSRRTLAEIAQPSDPTFFEMRSIDLVPDLERIPAILRSLPNQRRPRSEWIHEVMRRHFGDYSQPQIRGAIQALLESGEMQSATGKPRINKTVPVWFR